MKPVLFNGINWFNHLLFCLFFQESISTLLTKKEPFWKIIGSKNKKIKAFIQIHKVFSNYLHKTEFKSAEYIITLLHHFDKHSFPVNIQNKNNFNSKIYFDIYLVNILKLLGVDFLVIWSDNNNNLQLTEDENIHIRTMKKEKSISQGFDIVILTKTDPTIFKRKLVRKRMYTSDLITYNTDTVFVKNTEYSQKVVLFENDKNKYASLFHTLNDEKLIFDGQITNGQPCLYKNDINENKIYCFIDDNCGSLKVVDNDEYLKKFNITESFNCFKFNQSFNQTNIFINPNINKPFFKFQPSITYSLEYKESDRTLKCLRDIANLSTVKNEFKFDKSTFNKKTVLRDIDEISPKLKTLKENIEHLDSSDSKETNRKYKHFIFSDIASYHGAKILPALLMAMGMENIFDKNHNIVNLKTKSEKFAIISRTSIYGKSMSLSLIKSIFNIYNDRKKNTYGETLRFIILDRGFKEGVDLYDVKYVHLYEPQLSFSDEKQAIGRATRSCGQSGLPFHPKYGWPLYIFQYDTTFSDDLANTVVFSNTFHQYHLENMGINLKFYNFAIELEKTIIIGSIDYLLNKNIHNFKLDLDNGPEGVNVFSDKTLQQGGRGRTNKSILLKDFLEVREHIMKKYNHLKWEKIKVQNLCTKNKESQQKSLKDKIASFTPSQEFIKEFFTPEQKQKGLLLWHSVGTGKTCTAIAAASNNFESSGYTILWVTKSSLKSEMWKNMFDTICNIKIQNMIKENKVKQLSDNLRENKKLLSNSWDIQPLSYKQFSNLLSKQNEFYDILVKKNGEEDPLKKTLIIIDEAHKLYNQEDLSVLERPNMDIFYEMVNNSHSKSKELSVKLLLLTGTPYTNDPMNFIRLINLIKAENKFPNNYNEFEDVYLNDNGTFSQNGKLLFLNNIAGYVSYLNQQFDPRKFAQPILTNISSEMSKSFVISAQKEIDSLQQDIFFLTELIHKFKKDIKTLLEEKKEYTQTCKQIKNRKDKKECREKYIDYTSWKLKVYREHNKDLTNKQKEIKSLISQKKTLVRKKQDISQEIMLHNKCGII